MTSSCKTSSLSCIGVCLHYNLLANDLVTIVIFWTNKEIYGHWSWTLKNYDILPLTRDLYCLLMLSSVSSLLRLVLDVGRDQ